MSILNRQKYIEENLIALDIFVDLLYDVRDTIGRKMEVTDEEDLFDIAYVEGFKDGLNALTDAMSDVYNVASREQFE